MPKASPGQPYGFDLVNAVHGQERKTMARFICARCESNYLDVPVTTGQRLAPIGLARSAERKGWDADPVRRSHTRCPDCKARRLDNDVDAELKKVEAKMATSAPALLNGSATIVPVRDPTADERAEIRRLLEKNFDEGLGCYLAGYSDQRVAEEVNVPRVVVERLRDTAYGPIRVSPEMLAARKEVEELAQQIATLQDDATQWAQSFGEELDKLRMRLSQVRVLVGTKSA